MDDAMIMRWTLIGLLAVILVFGLVKYFPWSSGTKEAYEASEPTTLLDVNGDNAGTDLPPEEVPPEVVRVPVKKAIDDLVAQRLPTRELQLALMDLGQQYGKEGPESVKEFLLQLPPGLSSFSALVAALNQLPAKDLPGIIAWLATQEGSLGKISVRDGMGTAVRRWAGDDLRGVVAFLADPDAVKLPDSKRGYQIAYALRSAKETRPSDIVAIAETLQPGEVRSHVINEVAYIGARIKTGGVDLITSEIVAQPDEKSRDLGLKSLETLMRKLEVGRAPVLTSLLDEEFPEKTEYISSRATDWLRADTNAALEWLGESIEDAGLRDAVIAKGWKKIAEVNPVAAEQWIQSMAQGETKDAVLEAYGKFLSK